MDKILDGIRERGFWCENMLPMYAVSYGFPEIIALNSSGHFVLLKVINLDTKLTAYELEFFNTLIETYHARDLVIVYNLEQAITALEKA